MGRSEVQGEVLDAITQGDLPAALRHLNSRVLHRYSAVYRLDGDVLRCQGLFDKHGEPVSGFLTEVPLKDSFCQFVLKDRPFLVTDSSSDARLEGNPYQGVVLAYHAVPLIGEDGNLIGTLCHLDLRPQRIPDAELDYLMAAAELLAPLVAGTEAAKQ